MAGAHGNIWRKRVLLPLWIVQLLALVVFLGLTALALWVWDRASDDVADDYPQYSDDFDRADKIIDTGAAINLAFASFTILMTFVEMVLFCTHRLAPVANIVMQSIKSAIWTVYLILTIIAAVRTGASGGSVFLVLVIFLTCIGLLAYGATIVHRHRKGTLHRGNYAAASTGTAYEPSRYSQTTGYAGAPAPNPFRDPSPAPPYNPHVSKPAGAAGEYYGSGGSYEMQHGAGR